MNKITYLVGAGASAQKLPVVDNMGACIKKLHPKLSDIFKNSNGAIEFYDGLLIKDLFAKLLWLAEICETHSSVDTYAKKLFLNRNATELKELKNILSIYLLLEQKIKGADTNIVIDKRYDNFWASILMSRENLPDNIRVISWNYDSQFEISYANIFNTTIIEAYSELNILSPDDSIKSYSTDKFSIAKLNGSARLIKKRVGVLNDLEDFKENDKQFIKIMRPLQ